MNVERPNVKPTDLYSVREAAFIIGIGETTLRNWIAQGEFKEGVEYFKRKCNKRSCITGAGLLRVWEGHPNKLKLRPYSYEQPKRNNHI